MKKDNGLKYLAVAGGSFLFYICVLPVCDALSSWAQQAIANKITKLQYIAAQDQQETEEIADKINGTGPVQAIGFHVDNDELYVEGDEDYE